MVPCLPGAAFGYGGIKRAANADGDERHGVAGKGEVAKDIDGDGDGRLAKLVLRAGDNRDDVIIGDGVCERVDDLQC